MSGAMPDEINVWIPHAEHRRVDQDEEHVAVTFMKEDERVNLAALQGLTDGGRLIMRRRLLTKWTRRFRKAEVKRWLAGNERPLPVADVYSLGGGKGLWKTEHYDKAALMSKRAQRIAVQKSTRAMRTWRNRWPHWIRR